MRDKKKNLYTVISSPKQSNVIRFENRYLLKNNLLLLYRKNPY